LTWNQLTTIKTYNITAIQNKIIHIEPPRTNKKHILQCTRCQQYGHTRTYCNKPYACVKCGGPHNSTDCTKRRDMPAKWPCVAGIIRQTTKDVNITTTLSKDTIHTEPPQALRYQQTLPHTTFPHLPTTHHTNSNNNAATLTWPASVCNSQRNQ